MISIADLNDLDRNPQVAYDGYDELRAAARRRNGGFADPSEIPRFHEIIARRGHDWCQSVIGKPMFGGLESIPALDADMLLLADERDLNPPKPPWLVQWQAESEQARRAREERRTAALQRDADRWAEALAACGVPVEVRPNMHGRRYSSALDTAPLRHVVPAIDARSPKRRHPAGVPLCETAGRHQPRQLGEPAGDPATCKQCLTYTAQLTPALRVPAEGEPLGFIQQIKTGRVHILPAASPIDRALPGPREEATDAELLYALAGSRPMLCGTRLIVGPDRTWPAVHVGGDTFTDDALHAKCVHALGDQQHRAFHVDNRGGN
jgi:hypothetical protein